MKKIFTIIAAMACVGSVMTSCEKDNAEEPKALQPTDEKFLNTPPTANYVYELGTTSTVTLTCSQPNYGVGTLPTYAVQISLDPKFQVVPDQWMYTDADATPQPFVELPSTYRTTTLEIPAREIGDAINACRGYNQLAQVESPDFRIYDGPVYIRLRSYFPDAREEIFDTYNILSNIITLYSVKGTATLRMPGYIYLVGAPSGWKDPKPENSEHYENWKLFEADDKIGSQIYSGTFDIPADKFQFRFYSKLVDWDFNSIGSQNEDKPVDIELKDGVYSGAAAVGAAAGEGKGSWQIPNWTGGEVTITVNTKAKTVEFKKVN